MESGKTLHIPLSNVLSRIYSANHAPDPDQSENRCDADGMVSKIYGGEPSTTDDGPSSYPHIFGGFPLIADPRIPIGELHFRHADGRVDKMVNLNRECGQGAEGGCELGLGHPGGECMGRGPRGEYLVWEQGTGRLLREL